ncbi:MAG TPA: BlaI/MecI/CopY family transcriptional regulator [Planctomycetaceae bacterium]|jgi:predicted transcriptional regulator
MARPPAPELTERELEVMQVFWERGELSVAAAQRALNKTGRKRAYTTVGTLVRILSDKGFLEQANDERPFIFRPRRTYEDVSGKLLNGLLHRVFRGSWEQLLVRLVDEQKFSSTDRQALEEILMRHLGKQEKRP